jgi:acyl-CoA oxidase
MPGVIVGDCGHKFGINGVDNGFIIFDNVRIPKSNFLNKLSDVSDEGVFTSSIKNSD